MDTVGSHLSRAAELTKTEAVSKWHGALARIRGIQKKAEEKSGAVIETVEVVGGAFAISWVNGRYGQGGAPLQILNMDADLVVGGVALVTGMFDVFGRHSEHVLNLGAGILAAYASREGFNIGYQGQMRSGGSMNPFASPWMGPGSNVSPFPQQQQQQRQAA